MEAPVHSALEQAEKAFDRIGADAGAVRLYAGVFLLAVVDGV